MISATISSETPSCIINCPLANENTALCGFRKTSSGSDFEYKDFISNCGLDSANCGVTDTDLCKFCILTLAITSNTVYFLRFVYFQCTQPLLRRELNVVNSVEVWQHFAEPLSGICYEI